jgi:chaperonin GroEL
MSKEIIFGQDARLKIKAGIDKACDAVRPTLGAVGMTAMIEYKGLDPIECDDGVTILKNIELKDPYEQIGVQMIRKAGVRTSVEGGDGTATTTVLTQALVNAVFEELGDDHSKIREIRERLEAGLKEVLTELSKVKREVTEDDIKRIATISSLDLEVARLIAEIIKEIGVNGVVTVEKGSKLGLSKEVVKGMRFPRGWITPYLINDAERQQTVLEDVHIVLVDRKISSNEQILPMLQSIGVGTNILIIADDVESVALASLIQNVINGIAKIGVVRNPYNGVRGQQFLNDLAMLTGATVITESKGMKLSEATVALCGHAERVVISKDFTTVINGTSSDELGSYVEGLKNEKEESTSEYTREGLEERIAALTGGVGVIRVGAYTDTEFNAKKYKFENAINATVAALEEGIVAGGGVALSQLKIEDTLFWDVLAAPAHQMAVNAGVEDYDTVGWEKDCGINFKTLENVNMFEAGIIDPFKVTRLALESAVAIATALVSVQTVIVNEKEDVKEER